MNELIPIHTRAINGEDQPTVSARKLHEFLGNKDHFSTWIQDRIEQFSFVENQDFVTYSESSEKGRPSKEYDLTIDMGKELSMVERNARGKQARQYFIAMENKAKQLATVHFLVPKTLPEALRLAANLAEERDQLQAEIIINQPKVEFHDQVASAINCHTIQEVAKVIGTGQNRLFAWLRDNKMLMDDNQPMQNHLEAEHFKMIEKTYKDKRGEVHGYTQTLVTGKGLTYIQRRYTNNTITKKAA